MKEGGTGKNAGTERATQVRSALIDANDFEALRDSVEKLQLNDASFSGEMETSAALGFGFRCGFTGLLHLGGNPRPAGARI